MTSLEERFPRPAVVGIVNVTPDSFSDGGETFVPGAAVARARQLAADGAALVDVGGESTRPGASPVSLDEELRRVVPVLEELDGVAVSIDTAKAGVARRALELGAVLVNDVTALRGDPDLAGVVAGSGAYLCLMHMQGEPRTMQAEPRYDDVVADVAAFLEERLAFAVGEGIAEERICLDPGFGFGKTVEHNLALLRGLPELARLGRPLMVGISRKRALGRLLGDPDATTGSTAASVGAAVAAFERGAWLFRVHDVREHVEALHDRRRRGGSVITVEIEALELFGYHGVHEDEQRHGQRFLFDISYDVNDAALSDHIADAVDYSEVVALVRGISDGRRFNLLEALAAAVADALLARFPVARVRVRVRKPDVKLGFAVAWTAASVERKR